MVFFLPTMCRLAVSDTNCHICDCCYVMQGAGHNCVRYLCDLWNFCGAKGSYVPQMKILDLEMTSIFNTGNFNENFPFTHAHIAEHQWHKAFDTEHSEWKGTLSCNKLVAQWSYSSPYCPMLVNPWTAFCSSSNHGLNIAGLHKVSVAQKISIFLVRISWLTAVLITEHETWQRLWRRVKTSQLRHSNKINGWFTRKTLFWMTEREMKFLWKIN
jgi:hypothetical protein